MQSISHGKFGTQNLVAAYLDFAMKFGALIEIILGQTTYGFKAQ